jgi:hypothetical protein
MQQQNNCKQHNHSMLPTLPYQPLHDQQREYTQYQYQPFHRCSQTDLERVILSCNVFSLHHNDSYSMDTEHGEMLDGTEVNHKTINSKQFLMNLCVRSSGQHVLTMEHSKHNLKVFESASHMLLGNIEITGNRYTRKKYKVYDSNNVCIFNVVPSKNLLHEVKYHIEDPSGTRCGHITRNYWAHSVENKKKKRVGLEAPQSASTSDKALLLSVMFIIGIIHKENKAKSQAVQPYLLTATLIPATF